MRRILLVLAVAAMMMAVMAVPALAQEDPGALVDPGESVSQGVETPSGSLMSTGINTGLDHDNAFAQGHFNAQGNVVLTALLPGDCLSHINETPSGEENLVAPLECGD